MSNQLSQKPDFSDIPSSPSGMYDVGSEGQTPADIVGVILGVKEFKNDPELQILLRTNWTARECTIIMRVLIRAKFGLGLVERKDGEWAMPWLKQAVVMLGASRCSTDFHSVNVSKEVLARMQTKTEQQIKMNQI